MTLQEWMTKKGLTDQEMADRIGVDRSRVNRYRRNLAQPSLETLVNIVAVTHGKVRLADFVRPTPADASDLI